MKSLKWLTVSLVLIGSASTAQAAETATEDFSTRTYEIVNIDSGLLGTSERFGFDSGLNFEYPDAVRGIFVTGNSAGGARFSSLVELVENTDLNAMVIDVKEDMGHLTYTPEADSPLADKGIGTSLIKNPRAMLEQMEQDQIYPIARVVVFKDSVLAEQHPELSFTVDGQVWANNRGKHLLTPL